MEDAGSHIAQAMNLHKQHDRLLLCCSGYAMFDEASASSDLITLWGVQSRGVVSLFFESSEGGTL